MGFQKTKIEWATHTWNTRSGCKNGCWYCYARRIRERFMPNIPFSEIVQGSTDTDGIARLKEPARIFVGSMTDYFAEWAFPNELLYIIETATRFPQHMFIFLTKSPENYSRYEFPKNCWLGVTINHTGAGEADKVSYLANTKGNNIKFISYEPMLGDGYMPLQGIDWLILGALTGPCAKYHKPNKNDILAAVDRCSRYHVPLFMKDSLGWNKPIHQYPKGITCQ